MNEETQVVPLDRSVASRCSTRTVHQQKVGKGARAVLPTVGRAPPVEHAAAAATRPSSAATLTPVVRAHGGGEVTARRVGESTQHRELVGNGDIYPNRPITYTPAERGER